ncbi:hypothetical protein THASP1DRAFT_24647 [Thamnocephalis sphaerospora]|uniref:Uncharacterized protein n=1 Tax=Thamnocephalis sphaerospora TaxID=78915 RepID=A0A4P9XPG5_9FUNG|nr:hypothetical protein THASP1DRAFT_24647 [Thamnocephalis sphaerospora]|eukprot:RKP07150.1 hypothetical protein THASP1DRAFT_24647 [Thamnocephalis sphaerospora]
MGAAVAALGCVLPAVFAASLPAVTINELRQPGDVKWLMSTLFSAPPLALSDLIEHSSSLAMRVTEAASMVRANDVAAPALEHASEAVKADSLDPETSQPPTTATQTAAASVATSQSSAALQSPLAAQLNNATQSTDTEPSVVNRTMLNFLAMAGK